MTNQEKILHAFSNELVCNIVYHNKVSESTRKDQREGKHCWVTKIDPNKPLWYTVQRVEDGAYRTYYYDKTHTVTQVLLDGTTRAITFK